MASGLSAVSSMLVFDFLLKGFPDLPEKRRVLAGRCLMVAVLGVCIVGAPVIGRYHGLYGYLVRVWSLLAPPVFVCVVAGIFTRRANNRGAIATLITGSVLGAAAFVILNRPEWAGRLPVYFQSSLNVGFLITLACALVMGVVSHSSPASPSRIPPPAAGQPARDGTMTAGERRIYSAALAAVLLLLLAVTIAFSPWGFATTGAPLLSPP